MSLPLVGDVIVGMNAVTAARIPQGTILEAISDDAACLAYKVTTRQWTITGSGDTHTSEQMSGYSPHWLVVRVGEAEDPS